MPSTCPRCERSTDTDGAAFCMFCGERLSDPHATIAHVAAEEGMDNGMPSRIGGYRILRRLGEGGMGIVYEAEADESGHRVAVKLLSNRLAANPMSVERFKQEGRLASQISHPRCVFVYSADADLGRPFIVMELMPGLTLKDLVEQQGRLSPQDAVARIIDVVDGLIEAHRLGLIHRDVKPSNCFLTADDRVKVGDFGLSKSLLESEDGGQLTGTGAFLGTVLFAPPEQIRGEEVGYDSDVYSVCGTLYYLLAGRAPYQHESMTAALAKAISEPPPSLRRLRPDVPRMLERLVLKGLERDRKRRFVSLEELRDALQQLMPEEQVPARTRMLIAAYLVDTVLTVLLVQLPVDLFEWLVGFSDWLFGGDTLVDPVATVGYVLYFALCEGFAGATVGKWLLGLRVVPVGSVGPPGFGLATLRAGIFHFGWLLLWLGVICIVEIPAFGLPIGIALVIGGIAFLSYRVRQPNSNRGLHDLASGCHVVKAPRRQHRIRLTSLSPSRIEKFTELVSLPAELGGCMPRGQLVQDSDGSEVWLADDRSLGRRVLLHLLPNTAPTTIPPTRHARLRLLGTGDVQWQKRECTWHSFAAPAGAPIADMIHPNQPLDWADARLLLEQVVEELHMAEHDDSLPRTLSLNQIWVEPGGRVFLLDFALPSRIATEPVETTLDLIREMTTLLLEGTPRRYGQAVQAPLPPKASAIVNRLFVDESAYSDVAELHCELADSHAYEPVVTRKLRTTHLGIATLLLALPILIMFVYSAMISYIAATISWTSLQATHAVRVGLDQPAVLKSWQADHRLREPLDPQHLANTRQHLQQIMTERDAEIAREISWLSRPERYMFSRTQMLDDPQQMDPGQLTPVEVEAVISQITEPEENAAFSSMRYSLLSVAAFVCFVFLSIFAACAFLFRGGVAYLLANVALVRGDGRPAGRFRCMIREIALWMPFVTVLLVTAFIQVQWPAWLLGRTIAIACAVAVLVMYAAIGFRHPVRGPLDRIIGTYRVPV